MDGSNNELFKIEAAETQCLTRILSVTDSAPSSVAGAVLKNTASSGVARLQLDSNNSTGFARLDVDSAGGCSLTAPGQQISLQNQAGTAPVVIETDGDLTYNYGLNALSDARLKEYPRSGPGGAAGHLRQSGAQMLRSHGRAAQEPAGLRGSGLRGRRRHRPRPPRRSGAYDPGLLEALSRPLGSLQEAASQSGCAGEAQD